jgi:Rrf2 family protein
VRVSAKSDYAVRAAIELAGAEPDTPVKGEAIAAAQKIPMPFLENILAELRQHGLVHSKRGAEGGYWLAVPPEKITIAEIMRAVDGALATVRGEGADALAYQGSAVPLQDVWLALRANVRAVLEGVTLAQIVAGELPAEVSELLTEPEPQVPG